MKRFGMILCNIGLVLAIVVLVSSMQSKTMAATAVRESILKDIQEEKMGNALAKVFPQADPAIIEEATKVMNDNQEFKEMSEKYMDEVTNAMLQERDISLPNLQEDMYKLLDENMDSVEKVLGLQISDTHKSYIKQEVGRLSDSVQVTLQNMVYNVALSGNSTKKQAVQLYLGLSNDMVKYWLVLLLFCLVQSLSL